MQTKSVNREPVIETFHGTTVVDPYRWLEDRSSEETQAWIQEQNGFHDSYFAALPTFASLKRRVSGYLDVETVDQPARVGKRCFFRRRARGQEQACIYVQDDPTSVEVLLVDPSAHGPNVSVAIHRISDDGLLLAFTLKNGGERCEQLHFVDIETRQILEEHLEGGIARGLAFVHGNCGVFYCYQFELANEEGRPHEVRYHRFGDSFDVDEILISKPWTPRSRLILLSDEFNLGAGLVYENDGLMKIDFYLASRMNYGSWRPIFLVRAVPYSPFLHDGRIYVVDAATSQNGRVLRLNEGGCPESLIVPEQESPISALHFTRGQLYVSYLVDCGTEIRSWSWEGDFLGVLPTPSGGSARLLPALCALNETVFVEQESFSEPATIFEYQSDHRKYVAWEKQRPRRTRTVYDVRRLTYSSKDGTTIPLWLAAADSINTDKIRPTLMTAYGGFGVSMIPRFSVLVAIMLELGCVFALPNIRGGSEFGKSWHNAARKGGRQRAYDDFIGAAEWLVNKEITRPDQLGIFGGSNSGLLVATAITQRPELFKAVLCIAPILDMVRYEKFGNASKWRDEYGSIADEAEFRTLLAYSPYHGVSENVDYPATLFVTGDKDAECDPAHVRKMAARLQERPTQSHPILVDYSAERGHSAVLPLSVRIDALTRRLVFLCHELGITVPGGDGC